MFSILKKEVTGFFSTFTGYAVIALFLLINSLFMWVFPGEWNVLDSGYATLDTIFILSPWIFLFLVPAVTMRMISDEKRGGTLELLVTRPVSERGIVAGKLLASIILIILALIPAIIFYFSVYYIGDPQGNLDKGAIVGSTIGLFFLASVYASIGIFSSSLTDNQVIAFLIAVLLSFLMYAGFDSFALLPGLTAVDEIVIRFGINEHYRSISRGIVDIGDFAYFIGVVVIFSEATRLVLISRTWKK